MVEEEEVVWVCRVYGWIGGINDRFFVVDSGIRSDSVVVDFGSIELL